MKRLFKKLIVFMTVISILTGANVSYLSAATNPYLTGSKFNKYALKYYIDTTPTMTNLPPDKEEDYLYWNSDIQSAFNMWDSIIETYGIDITFTKTSTLSQADIIVKYHHTDKSYMETVHTWSSSTVYKTSTVYVDDFQLVTSPVTDEVFWLSILHEIGHTIGLQDILASTAEANGFTSIMVNNVRSPYHSEYPTYDFDRHNILEMYP